MADAQQSPASPPKRAPTLYAITTFKLVKGLACAALAFLIYKNSDRDLPAIYDNVLSWLHDWLRVNPERKFWTDMALAVENLTQAKVVHFAMGTFIYGLFSLVEGVGLLFRVTWAGWLTIGESAFFIPIEISHLSRNPSWVVFTILGANIVIVVYLFLNRGRLFHSHHRR